MQEDGRRAWVGWGGKRSRGEYGVSRQGECQSKHSEVAVAQVRSYRDGVLVGHIVDTLNVLIRHLPGDAINCLVGKILHGFAGQSRGHDGEMLCP